MAYPERDYLKALILLLLMRLVGQLTTVRGCMSAIPKSNLFFLHTKNRVKTPKTGREFWPAPI